ncbi:hypothetical protein MFLAVUS_005755 [Mucor flavus]|uniref:Profilin n=1 Tax=Mucor flavus TaxID=439312 RepID=A0ABP9YZM3_9FUNG
MGTLKPVGVDYTFALAHVDDVRNPLAGQEACYYSCGAQIVTQSANRGDMSKLTLMDTSANLLASSGFLKVGESYLLNHLGLEDSEGVMFRNGIGCIQVKPGNRLSHFDKSHPVCSMARGAICGFWGQQSIPMIPSGMKMTTLPAPEPATVPLPTAVFPQLETETDLQPFIEAPKSTAVNSPSKFNFNGKDFHIVSKNQQSSAAANSACQVNQATVATITTDSFQGISNKLKSLGQSKMIIGSWNGDSYSLTGASCLIMQVDYGIYPGNCVDALSVLCQSQ